jgi:ribonuclease HII
MVVAGFAVGARDLPRLSELGVRDSKLLTPKRRETLAPVLEAMAGGVHRVELSPAELDKGNLTDLELEAFAQCILALKPAAVYADAPVGPRAIPRFRARLLERLAPFSPELILENRADVRFPVVSAASILAKVRRDRRIAELKAVHGEIGSGYPGDPVTRRFLIAWMERHGSPPPMARTRWATFDRLAQRRLAF